MFYITYKLFRCLRRFFSSVSSFSWKGLQPECCNNEAKKSWLSKHMPSQLFIIKCSSHLYQLSTPSVMQWQVRTVTLLQCYDTLILPFWSFLQHKTACQVVCNAQKNTNSWCLQIGLTRVSRWNPSGIQVLEAKSFIKITNDVGLVKAVYNGFSHSSKALKSTLCRHNIAYNYTVVVDHQAYQPRQPIKKSSAAF